MKNKTKGVIAGLAGLALLSGGTTFALWSDSDSIPGGTITNGELGVSATSVGWFDVSPDRTDVTVAATPVTELDGHTVDLQTWRMVPGDVAEGTYGLDVTLVGDNLVANLDVTSSGGTTPLPEGLVVSYQVFDANGTDVTAGVLDGTSTTLRFAAPRTGQAAGAPVNTGTVVVDGTTAADLFVVVTADWSAEASGTTAASTMNAATALKNLAVSLQQDRSGADFS
ncbi:alternate-type signal peptide domain-containing protein [Cellulomonas palmilytica]|uniref:alternate-type signal peptide domain-containing protein n=1 Tax=Cellulomonas palmilytica TaxID=2608402 RepID=UPI001F38ACB1|nr:alternate-type signal peptide domain-containing protein [Cellulomonas palmilytica]UJP39806.1 alternate-type signal peptide domain-containing protein [Cellulomonas palmilytica]